jgi:hypothetical protein
MKLDAAALILYMVVVTLYTDWFNVKYKDILKNSHKKLRLFPQNINQLDLQCDSSENGKFKWSVF